MILAKVRVVVADVLELSEAAECEITPESDLSKDLGADSLARLEMVMDLEEAFGIDIDDEQAAKMCTVRDVVDVIAASLRDLASAAG